jgi:hypothetical protein
MEVIGNIYDGTIQGISSQADALTSKKAKNPKTKISSKQMRALKWAFNMAAMAGWIVIALIVIDTIIFNGHLLTGFCNELIRLSE